MLTTFFDRMCGAIEALVIAGEDWRTRRRCAHRGHPLEARRVLYVGGRGLTQRDDWRECACGQRSTEIKRARIALPY